MNEAIIALIKRWRTEVGCNAQSPDDSKEMWFNTGKNHAILNCARELEELFDIEAEMNAPSFDTMIAKLK